MDVLSPVHLLRFASLSPRVTRRSRRARGAGQQEPAPLRPEIAP